MPSIVDAETLLCCVGDISRVTCSLVVLDVLVASVLPIGPKVHVFELSRGRWIFKGDKNPQRALLRRESKASTPGRKILLHVKGTIEV
jgi:hypothetical protein